LGWPESALENATQPAARPSAPAGRAVAALGDVPRVERLAVRETLAIVTFYWSGSLASSAKVVAGRSAGECSEHPQNYAGWSAATAIRPLSGVFEKIIEESPAFDTLQARTAGSLARF